MRTSFCSPIRWASIKWLVVTLALAAVALVPTSVFAQANTCLGDVSTAKSCSANDVSLASVDGSSVNVFSGGIAGTNKCYASHTFSFIANFTIHTTSNARRSNVGIYFGTGQNSALHGSCSDSILAPRHVCAGASSLTCGDASYEELDTNGEPACAANGSVSPCGCGDTSSTDNGGTGNQVATLEVDNATCPASGNLTIPYCTSWYQPTANTPECLTTSPSYPWVSAASAGSPSKCNCQLITIPVQPISPAISVTKMCQAGGITSTTQCNAGAEGGTVTYAVRVTNTTTSAGGGGGVVVDQICDDQYGNIYTANGFTGKACPAGALCTGDNNVEGGKCWTNSGCATSPLGDIASGSSGLCTFTVAQGEIATVKDIVTVTGHSDISTTVSTGAVQSNQVTVTSTDAPTTVTSSLSYAGPQHACVTQRYTVLVQNTSSADESVVLQSTTNNNVTTNALQDARYGNLSSTHGDDTTNGSVLGTTCGVAPGSYGLGTMAQSGLTPVQAVYSASDCLGGGATADIAHCNGGDYPVTLTYGSGTPPTSNGGFYQCQFDGVVCGSLNSNDVASCSAGMKVTDAGVTPNITLDNGEVVGTGVSYTVNVKAFTTNICVSTPSTP